MLDEAGRIPRHSKDASHTRVPGCARGLLFASNGRLSARPRASSRHTVTPVQHNRRKRIRFSGCTAMGTCRCCYCKLCKRQRLIPPVSGTSPVSTCSVICVHCSTKFSCYSHYSVSTSQSGPISYGPQSNSPSLIRATKGRFVISYFTLLAAAAAGAGMRGLGARAGRHPHKFPIL